MRRVVPFRHGQPRRQCLLTGRQCPFVPLPAEEELRSLVHGLCAFNDKQLRAVSHLLPVEHMAAIRIAADIPPTNQVCALCLLPTLTTPTAAAHCRRNCNPVKLTGETTTPRPAPYNACSLNTSDPSGQ